MTTPDERLRDVLQALGPRVDRLTVTLRQQLADAEAMQATIRQAAGPGRGGRAAVDLPWLAEAALAAGRTPADVAYLAGLSEARVRALLAGAEPTTDVRLWTVLRRA